MKKPKKITVTCRGARWGEIHAAKKREKDNMIKCEAIQYSDQMHCETCNFSWDMNDSNPPECRLQAMEQAMAPKIKIHVDRYKAKVRHERWQSVKQFGVRVFTRLIDAALISAGIYLIAWLLSIFGVVSY